MVSHRYPGRVARKHTCSFWVRGCGSPMWIFLGFSPGVQNRNSSFLNEKGNDASKILVSLFFDSWPSNVDLDIRRGFFFFLLLILHKNKTKKRPRYSLVLCKVTMLGKFINYLISQKIYLATISKNTSCLIYFFKQRCKKKSLNFYLLAENYLIQSAN